MSKRPHVLVVDDDVQILGLFMRTLTRANYVVTGTTSGADALDLAQRASPSLVILDLSMPDPDGFEMLKYLHTKKPDVKVLVMSGAIQGVILNAATLFGAVATLEKPVPPESLLQAVDRVLSAEGRDHTFSAGRVLR